LNSAVLPRKGSTLILPSIFFVGVCITTYVTSSEPYKARQKERTTHGSFFKENELPWAGFEPTP
jgi:hypothetical protein